MSNDEEISSDLEDAWYLRQLDGGLYTLQTTDYILAWIIMEDDGVRFTIYVSYGGYLTQGIDPNPCPTNAWTERPVIEGRCPNIKNIPRQHRCYPRCLHRR